MNRKVKEIKERHQFLLKIFENPNTGVNTTLEIK